MNLDNIIRCRDCEHSGQRTKRKTSICALCGEPTPLDTPMTCASFKDRQDKPAQKKWKANRDAFIAFMRSRK